ncbi:hypothetical protein PX669_15275 [Acinetobacter soli]|nr:hypothetical protein PX669_15275 [Acinetobacter soli]
MKRIFKTRLNYDVLDASGNIIKENNKELKGLKTEKAGLTQLHYSNEAVKFRFYNGDLGSVKVSTDLITPFFHIRKF